ncbi:HIRA-interacting protein 3 isoform X2 [Neovison vison]|uniref:HIRA-interacting protein 3 isoform X2 n=1 Tax=Neovison vison TaxID=452646 RepID=UPI001CF00A8B|nr:HIRA-interacting protein 3 isoform X2 [Neogale vison]
MAREDEMQEFIRRFFRGRPDLSTLTHSIVRRRFLAHAGRDHLEPDEKQALKRLVEEELLKVQVDEVGAREERPDLAKKATRPPTPSSGPGRKRFRFNSESEPSSAASSPDCFRPSAKNGMVADIRPAEEESPKRASKKAIEESSDEEELQRELAAKTGSEKVAAKESSEEEEEGSARTSKVSKEESGEEEEEEEEASKGRIRKETVTRSKQAPGKTSADGKRARDSEDSEEEPIQTTRKKAEGKKVAKSHQESEKDSEEEDTLARKKDNREEEEGNWKAGARGNGRKKSSWEERSSKQNSRTARLPGNSEDREGQKETAAAGSGDDSGGDDKPLVQSRRKDRASRKHGKRQSGSSEDGGDGWKKLPPATEGAGRTAKAGSICDGSPEPKGRKAGSGRRGEDHPAVMRLKRYIRACGAHRNYKKLLGPCRSHKERLSVLRAELEALGMKGNPSLEKCRALKEQREEAAEVASLDVTNIISGSGRPRRRTAWNPSREADTPGELYCRTLGSEDEQPRAPPPDWSHMRGIISSDGESN